MAALSETAGADEMAQGILAGDRGALARAITLVESRKPEDIERAQTLLREDHPARQGRSG